MIKDTKGRKWFMRFKQYQQGWQWEARHDDCGQESGSNFFATKALAEEDARRSIQGHDSIAMMAEFFRRVRLRGGAACQLTADDHNAIRRAAGITNRSTSAA